MIDRLKTWHDVVFGWLSERLAGWGVGLAARLAFASVLLVYFLNSAATKVGSGFPGILIPEIGAYAQMLPAVAEAAGYNIDAIAVFPYKLIVLAGTLGEVLLPMAIVIGLFTRLASLGMIIFIAVMTFVDITGHGAEPATIGAPFDRIQDAAIWDQRLLWVFLLFLLVVQGAGRISLDALLARKFANR
ncbi:MAG: DoxX family membrane protein [Rhodospirillales bacterium]